MFKKKGQYWVLAKIAGNCQPNKFCICKLYILKTLVVVETTALKNKTNKQTKKNCDQVQGICVIYLSSEEAILSLFKLTKVYLGKRENVKLYAWIILLIKYKSHNDVK